MQRHRVGFCAPPSPWREPLALPSDSAERPAGAGAQSHQRVCEFPMALSGSLSTPSGRAQLERAVADSLRRKFAIT